MTQSDQRSAKKETASREKRLQDWKVPVSLNRSSGIRIHDPHVVVVLGVR